MRLKNSLPNIGMFTAGGCSVLFPFLWFHKDRRVCTKQERVTFSKRDRHAAHDAFITTAENAQKSIARFNEAEIETKSLMDTLIMEADAGKKK